MRGGFGAEAEDSVSSIISGPTLDDIDNRIGHQSLVGTRSLGQINHVANPPAQPSWGANEVCSGRWEIDTTLRPWDNGLGEGYPIHPFMMWK